jgi:hypothetical protein
MTGRPSMVKTIQYQGLVALAPIEWRMVMSTLLRSVMLAGLVAVTTASGALASTRDRDIGWKGYGPKAPAAEAATVAPPILHEGRAATMTEPRVLHEGRAATAVAPRALHEGRAATTVAPRMRHEYVRPLHPNTY